MTSVADFSRSEVFDPHFSVTNASEASVPNTFSVTSTVFEGRELEEEFGASQEKFDAEKASTCDSSAFTGDSEEDNSSIEIVRDVVPACDDPSLPVMTFRFWVLGTLFTVIGAAVSQYYSFRSNSLSFSILFVQLITYPLGRLMAIALPTRNFELCGWKFTLNPGPFNIKEHLLISVVASSGGLSAYGSMIIAIQKIYYNEDIGFVGGILLLCTTQLIGYGMSGMLRRHLVTPPSMVWPVNLVQVSLFNTLHENEGFGSNTRMRYFAMIFGAIFVWEFFPTLIFPTLSSFAVLCLIDNSNWMLRTLGSSFGEGFGFFTLSFDWNVIGTFAPMYTPWWTSANYYFGLISMAWLVGPIIYYSNFWDAQLYPPASPRLFRKDGQPYMQDAVLTNNQFDQEKYNNYGPIYLTPYFAFCYAITFATLTALVTHVYLWYGKDIVKHLKASRIEDEDVHGRLMRAYPDVPNWWYALLGGSMFLAAMIVCEVYPTKLPWWGVIAAVTIAAIFVLPVGIIQAISNVQIGLNIFAEFIAGYILPGRPIANVVFKTYAYMGVTQCLGLVRDLKLGYYMKIPPRAMFIAQVYGTIVGALVNYGVLHVVLDTKGSFLNGSEVDPTGQWSGRAPAVFNAASIIWGLIGPGRFFGSDSLYRGCLWAFLIGAFLPIPFYLLHKRYPNAGFNLINMPIICSGAYAIPQMPTNVIVSGLIVAFLSQFYAVRYRPNWFRKYNLITAAALDAGTALSAIFLFVTFTGFPGKQFPEWWGNSYTDTEHCTPGS